MGESRLLFLGGFFQETGGHVPLTLVLNLTELVKK